MCDRIHRLFQSDPSTAFLRAARAGQLEKVLEYLESGVDINASNAVSHRSIILFTSHRFSTVYNDIPMSKA